MSNFEIDGHQWMRRLGLEVYRLAELRRLQVGDQLWVAFFDGPGLTHKAAGRCEAYFERVKGGYRFNATWTLNLTAKPHAHVLTFGEFKLLPGRRIQFPSLSDERSEVSFRRVCRYAAFINHHARAFGIEERWLGHPYHCHRLWRGMTVFKDGLTKYGVPGPNPKGLKAVIETFFAAMGEGEELHEHQEGVENAE